MLIIDDLLLAPLKGVLWIADKIQEAAQEELAGEAEAITEELRQLYVLIERAQITEAEFEERERKLLDRLDKVRERDADAAEEPDGAVEADGVGGLDPGGEEEA